MALVYVFIPMHGRCVRRGVLADLLQVWLLCCLLLISHCGRRERGQGLVHETAGYSVSCVHELCRMNTWMSHEAALPGQIGLPATRNGLVSYRFIFFPEGL